jgi:hypothetical protein
MMKDLTYVWIGRWLLGHNVLDIGAHLGSPPSSDLASQRLGLARSVVSNAHLGGAFRPQSPNSRRVRGWRGIDIIGNYVFGAPCSRGITVSIRSRSIPIYEGIFEDNAGMISLENLLTLVACLPPGIKVGRA